MEDVVAAPSIVETVGDVGRPRCPFSQVTDTRHTPGKQGLLNGLGTLAGWLRHGHDYVRASAKKSGAYMPFGSGAHSCIGALLASLEARAFWHAFLTRASFRLVKPYAARHELKPLGMVSGRVEFYVDPVAVRPLPSVRFGVDAELPHPADQACPWEGEQPRRLGDGAAARP